MSLYLTSTFADFQGSKHAIQPRPTEQSKVAHNEKVCSYIKQEVKAGGSQHEDVWGCWVELHSTEQQPILLMYAWCV